MLNKIKYSLLVIFASLLFEGCKNEMIGPDIEALGGEPNLISVFTRSQDTVKILKPEVIYFNAKFENKVVWQILLTGEESGATFKLSGVGDEINQNNSTWSGISDNPPKKFSNEKVAAVLSFPNSPNVPSSTIKFYIFSNGAFNNTGSVLVSDFTKTKFYGFGQSHPNDGNKWWPSEYPLPSTGIHTAFEPSLDGNTYAYMTGKPVSTTNPKVFYAEMTAADRDGGLSTDLTFPLYVNPDLVYFNVDVYSTGTPNYAWLILVFVESDGSERQLIIKQPNWSGWKRISVKYSDLVIPQGGVAKWNPDELSKIGMVLLSANTDLTQTVTIAIDHPIFTFGQPYQP